MIKLSINYMNKLQIRQPVSIIANGSFPCHKIPLDILKQSNTIIACDGAANMLDYKKYKIDYIIGDLDSIEKSTLNKHKSKIINKHEQTNNDLRKAMILLYNNNIKEFSILGATGKREDHTIGNIFSIYELYDDLNATIFTDNGSFKCINSSTKIESFKGQQVSLFSNDKTITINSNGLKYNYRSECISSLFYGTLNESMNNIFSLDISHGKILIYQNYKQ